MFDSNKSGIKSCLIKLLQLNDEDKKFVKDLEREKLEHHEEYYPAHGCQPPTGGGNGPAAA